MSREFISIEVSFDSSVFLSSLIIYFLSQGTEGHGTGHFFYWEAFCLRLPSEAPQMDGHRTRVHCSSWYHGFRDTRLSELEAFFRLRFFSLCVFWDLLLLFWTEAVVSSGRVEKSPHEQEIKFFAKVSCSMLLYRFEHWEMIPVYYPAPHWRGIVFSSVC